MKFIKIGFGISIVLFSCAASAETVDEQIVDVTLGVTEKPAKDLPSSVTVITRRDIQTLGLTKIEDVLRLIPGIAVTQSGTSRPLVSYHGTNAVLPRRTKVLVDGMSLHRVADSVVYWVTFPVSIDDIERVEVYRNHVYPKSGSKTLQATINIITRHPSDVTDNSISLDGDTLGYARQSMAFKNQIGDTNFYLRFENMTNTGFDKAVIRDSSGASRTIVPYDGANDTKVSLRSSTPLNESLNLDVLAGVSEGDVDIETRDSNATGWKDEGYKNKFINLNLHYSGTVNEFNFGANIYGMDKIKEWHTCYPLPLFTDELRALNNANPAYAETIIAGKVPTGGTPQDDMLAMAVFAKIASLGPLAGAKQCGFINENFSDARRVLNFDHTRVFNDSLMITSGYEYQNNYFDSQTLAGGTIEATTHNIHSTAHFRASEAIGLSAGGNYYEVDMRDDSSGKFSYHAGINFDYLSTQTVKLVVSQTHRSPEPLEQHALWSYYMTEFSIPFSGKNEGYFYRTTSNTGAPLHEEDFKTFELDFAGSFLNKRIEYDLKFFKEELSNLISEDLVFTRFEPTNDSYTELKGAEFLVRYHFNESINLLVSGTDIRNESTKISETNLSLRDAGYLALLYNGERYLGSISYFGSQGIFDNSFDRFELHLRRNFTFGNSLAHIYGRIRYQPSDFVASPGSINAAGTGRDGNFSTMEYSEKTSLMVGVGIDF